MTPMGTMVAAMLSSGPKWMDLGKKNKHKTRMPGRSQPSQLVSW